MKDCVPFSGLSEFISGKPAYLSSYGRNGSWELIGLCIPLVPKLSEIFSPYMARAEKVLGITSPKGEGSSLSDINKTIHVIQGVFWGHHFVLVQSFLENGMVWVQLGPSEVELWDMSGAGWQEMLQRALCRLEPMHCASQIWKDCLA